MKAPLIGEGSTIGARFRRRGVYSHRAGYGLKSFLARARDS